MTDTPETNFINDYEPGSEATVELKNARIVDVKSGTYYDPAIRIVLKGGKIDMMPGFHGESVEFNAD